MADDLTRRLEIYGELAVRIGLNLQAGQRLLIIGPLANGGASLEAAPLVREIAAAAYRAGAFASWRHAGATKRCNSRAFNTPPRDSFGEFSHWFSKTPCSNMSKRATR